MDMPAETLPPYRHVNYAARRVEIDERPDGSIVLRTHHPAGDPDSTPIAPFRQRAVGRPDHVRPRPPLSARRRPPFGGG